MDMTNGVTIKKMGRSDDSLSSCEANILDFLKRVRRTISCGLEDHTVSTAENAKDQSVDRRPVRDPDDLRQVRDAEPGRYWCAAVERTLHAFLLLVIKWRVEGGKRMRFRVGIKALVDIE